MSHVSIGENQRGIALLGVMAIVLILSLLATTLLNLAGQEAQSAGAGGQAAVAQQLADAASELAIAWFHDPQATSPDPRLVVLRGKRNHDAEGAPSFFDPNGRSQFVGTAAQPDVNLAAENSSDNRILNDPEVGMFRAMHDLGQVEELKVYAPLNPGLLCTIEATIATHATPSVKQSVVLQLGALHLRPLSAAVQVTQHLGGFQLGHESPVRVHWGDVRVGEDLVLNHEQDVPVKSAIASITALGYDEATQHEDRWTEVWVGGQVRVTQPSPEQAHALSSNIHEKQNPVPGVRLDQWAYDDLKQMAKRFGRYFAIDRDGLLYPQGTIEAGRGLSPDEVLTSRVPGDQQGLVFIDTLDQTPPRSDNLGVLRLKNSYIEGILVVQGHVVLSPHGTGSSIRAMSPSHTGPEKSPIRLPIQLPGIHINGVLYANGNITVDGKVKLYGAVVTGGTVTASSAGGTLEVWYDQDLGEGFFRGLPVVYRAPGTWMVKY